MKNNSTTALPNQINKVFFDFQLSSSLEHFIRCSCDTADKPRLTIEVFCCASARQGDHGSPPARCPPSQQASGANTRGEVTPAAPHCGTAGPPPPRLQMDQLLSSPGWGCCHSGPGGRAALGPPHPQHPRQRCRNTLTIAPNREPGAPGTALPHRALPAAAGRGDLREPTHERGTAAAPSSAANRAGTSTRRCPPPQGTRTGSARVLPSPRRQQRWRPAGWRLVLPEPRVHRWPVITRASHLKVT